MKGKPAPHIKTNPAGATVRVTLNGEVIAESRDAIAMKEGDCPVVYYIPRKKTPRGATSGRTTR